MLLSQEMALCHMKNCWHRCTKLMRIFDSRLMRVVKFGASTFHIPVGVSVISNSHHSRLKKAAALKKKLDDLFNGKECLLNREALIILTAFGLHNFGVLMKPLRCA